MSTNLTAVRVDSGNVFEEPLCLLDHDRVTGKFRIHLDVLDQIEQIEKQLNTVSIAGRYRSGKSYLMCRLAGKNRGFPLGSAIQSETKGIWVWCLPHPLYKDQVLLLMDSEGLGDVDKGDEHHDHKIFTLVTLLSGTLIYNILSSIDYDSIEKLTLITEISRNIKTKESNKTADDSDFDLYFPQLIFAVRDFSVEMKINGEPVNADGYLEYCLGIRKGDDDTTKKRNQSRMCIRKYFKHRRCFVFECPGYREILLELERLPDDKLNPNFVNEVGKFVDFIHRQCKPMKINNAKVLNGSMFGQMVRSHVQAVNSGQVPCIESTIRSIKLIENPKAVSLAVEAYKTKMKGDLTIPVPDQETMTKAHTSAIRYALDVFRDHAFMDENQEYHGLANDSIWQEFIKMEEEDEKCSRTVCKDLLTELYDPIKRSFTEGKYNRPGGYDSYQADFEGLEKDYKSTEKNLGVMKDEALRLFIDECEPYKNMVLEADKAVDKNKKTIEKKKQNRETAERLEKSTENVRNRKVQELIAKKSHVLEVIQIQKAWSEQQQESDREINKKISEGRFCEQQRLIKEEQLDEAEKTEAELQKFRKENEEKERKEQEYIRELQSKADTEIGLLEKMINYVKSCGDGSSIMGGALIGLAVGSTIGSKLGNKGAAAAGGAIGGATGAGICLVACGITRSFSLLLSAITQKGA